MVGSDALSEGSEWVTFEMLLYCGLLQFLRHLTPSAPGFLSIKALWVLFQMGRAWNLQAFTDPLCYVHHMLQSFWTIFTMLHVLSDVHAFVLANPSA